MKIRNFLKATVLMTLIFAMQSMVSVNGVEGTWAYDAPNAPYEYQEGEIIIKKADGKYSALIKFQYDSLEVKDVKVDKNAVVMKFYVDGELIVVKLKTSGDDMTGIAETPEGDLEVTGKRK